LSERRFVLLVLTVTLGWIMTLVNQNVETVSHQTASLVRFVDELERETAEERAQNAAVARAVALVPTIRDTLVSGVPAKCRPARLETESQERRSPFEPSSPRLNRSSAPCWRPGLADLTLDGSNWRRSPGSMPVCRSSS
jgi:hypothetical protein